MDQENRKRLSREELRDENEFLKMKMMLENGAVFGKSKEGEELPPEIEHQFLNSIMEFEKKFIDPPQIKVYDKIGRPTHFRAVHMINENEFDSEWKQLNNFLRQHGIELGACSPKVTSKELYRFTIEELFNEDIDDVDIPGLIHGIIYDQYHPDEEFDNSLIAVDHCMRSVLDKDKLEWDYCFFNEGLRLNEFRDLSSAQLLSTVNKLRIKRDTWQLSYVDSTNCIIQDQVCKVKGEFSALDKQTGNLLEVNGTWLVTMERDSDTQCWYIREIDIEGIDILIKSI